MGQMITPTCDRCGKKGIEGETFAQMKLVERHGRVRVMDLCFSCEALLDAWMDDDKATDEGENRHGTD